MGLRVEAKEPGFFSITPRIIPFLIFSGSESRSGLTTSRTLTPDERASLRHQREFLCRVIGVDSFAEIPARTGTEEERSAIVKRATPLLAKMFGVEGMEDVINARMGSYANTARDVMTYVRGVLPPEIARKLEMSFLVQNENNPVRLLLTALSDRRAPLMRYEALRQFILMKFAADVEHREIESDITGKYGALNGFLEEHVFSGELYGETITRYYQTAHDQANFACTGFTEIAPNEYDRRIDTDDIEPLHQLVTIDWRQFSPNKRHGRQTVAQLRPVHLDSRKKPLPIQVIKTMRYDVENPARGIEDEYGAEMTLLRTADLLPFIHRLAEAAEQAGSFMLLEDVRNTLTGKTEGVPMYKFYARLLGIRPEFILHTLRSRINYQCQKGISHREYVIKRVFKPEVMQNVCPDFIYPFNREEAQSRALSLARERIERPGVLQLSEAD